MKADTVWPFVPGLFPLALCFQGSSGCSLCQRFTPFYDWIVFHCVWRKHILFYPSIGEGHFGYFHRLVTVNGAAGDLCVHMSVYFPF